MKVAILYYNFLDSSGAERKLGGKLWLDGDLNAAAQGAMDHFRVYGRALDMAEITWLCERGNE